MSLPTKINSWQFTLDGRLQGEVSSYQRNPNHHAVCLLAKTDTIITSKVVGVRGLNGQTIVETKGGSRYMLSGPSKHDQVRAARNMSLRMLVEAEAAL